MHNTYNLVKAPSTNHQDKSASRKCKSPISVINDETTQRTEISKKILLYCTPYFYLFLF